jgi:hypothetical protein
LCEKKFGEMGEREWHTVSGHVKRTEKQYVGTAGLIGFEADI